MPERPLLILPTPGNPITRSRGFGGGGNIGHPSLQKQAQRLGPKFQVLQRAFAQLRVDAAGITPEKVLVLETAGPIEEFFGAVQNIDGMEWLGEIEQEEIPPDDDFFALDSKGQRKPEKTIRGRVLLVFTNHQALDQLLSLWRRWQNEERLPYGLGKWGQLITYLIDIRPWGIQDRLQETGVLSDWRERVEHNEEIIPFEIELWYRKSRELRQSAGNRVIGLVEAQQGHILHEVTIEEIAYHSILVTLPIGVIIPFLEEAGQDTALVQCEQIQFFRATGQMAAILPEIERISDDIEIGDLETPLNEPVVALLDGMPLQNHRALADYLIIDDPDEIEIQYQAHERKHGTAMASLIIQGELDAQENAISQRLYVRPILQPDVRDWRRAREETVPENLNVVDLIHRAVRRLFEGEGGEPPAAPSICVVNLSIGIKDRLFYGALSPLARLLDWLAWKYQVLFIVSAGNHTDPIELGIPRSEFSGLAESEVQEIILKAIAADARNRRLLSPAEAVNALTIGGLHYDSSGSVNLPRAIDPYVDEGLPSPFNAQGLGFRRAIKPEILTQGGRAALLEGLTMDQNAVCEFYQGTLAPGQKVAAPGPTPGDVSASCYFRGTSNAAALTSRGAAILHDVLDQLRSELGGELIDSVPRAVWLKALLTHATEWGNAGAVLFGILRTPENSRQFKEYITRLLGYGGIDVSRVWECTEYRVTALSGGTIEDNQAYIHTFPLPPSLSGQRGWRRLKITLSWLSPVNPLHQKWRRAGLWFTPPKELLRIDRQQAQWQAVQRGTVQHEILEGDRAAAFLDGDNLEIQVNCSADAGALEEAVPYSLVVTLEVAEEIGVPIYDEVRVRVQAARVRITPPGQGLS